MVYLLTANAAVKHFFICIKQPAFITDKTLGAANMPCIFDGVQSCFPPSPAGAADIRIAMKEKNSLSVTVPVKNQKGR